MKIPKSIQADLALLLVTVIWGSTFTIVKKSLVQASPILFIALRFWLATAVTIVFIPGALRGMSRKTLRNGLILATVLLAGFIFQTLGLRNTPPSRSAFITSLSVIFVPILGYSLYGRKPRMNTLAGIILAGVGLGLLTLRATELKFRQGDILTLICAVVFALHILLLSRYLTQSDYRQLVILQFAGSASLCTLLIPMLEVPFLVWDFSFAAFLGITGILATALGFYVQNRAQQYTSANRAALIFGLEPFFAVLFAYLLLGQALTAREWLGGALVMAGIIIAEVKRSPAD
jgi:drug/metabolite transporter (DMT)-like permease